MRSVLSRLEEQKRKSHIYESCAVNLLHCSFVLPEGLRLANLEGLQSQQEAKNISLGVYKKDSGSGIAAIFVTQIDSGLTWEFLSWLRTFTQMPVFVKASPHQASILPSLCMLEANSLNNNPPLFITHHLSHGEKQNTLMCGLT